MGAAILDVDGTLVDTVMVGDTPWDAKAAGRAGIETVAVLTAAGPGVASVRAVGIMSYMTDKGVPCPR